MKIRLADVIGGAAKSLDERFKEDMRRTEERAENTAKERRQKKEAAKAKEKEFDEAMRTYVEGIQSTLGPNATYKQAVAVVKDYGGNLAGAERAYKNFTESADAGIDVSSLVKYTQGTDSATLSELIEGLRPIRTSMQPLGAGEVTGAGFLKGVDLSERINEQTPISTQTRKTFDIGTATVDRTGLLSGREFDAEYNTNKDDKFKTTENILAFGQQLMLENSTDQSSEGYIKGKQYYDMAQATLKETKKNETADSSTKLNPRTAIAILNQTKNSMYDAEFTQTVGDALEAKLSGTASYKSYFQAQPNVIDEIQQTAQSYNNDETLLNFLRVEKRAYKTNIGAYINKFTKSEIPENKAVIFRDETTTGGGTQRVFSGYAPAVNISKANEDAMRGVYSVGDILNIEQDGNQVVAVWTGTEWSN